MSQRGKSSEKVKFSWNFNHQELGDQMGQTGHLRHRCKLNFSLKPGNTRIKSSSSRLSMIQTLNNVLQRVIIYVFFDWLINWTSLWTRFSIVKLSQMMNVRMYSLSIDYCKLNKTRRSLQAMSIGKHTNTLSIIQEHSKKAGYYFIYIFCSIARQRSWKDVRYFIKEECINIQRLRCSIQIYYHGNCRKMFNHHCTTKVVRWNCADLGSTCM